MVFFVLAASDDNAVEVVGNAIEYSLVWIVVGMVVATGITMNRKNSSFAVWYMVTWISYTRMLGVINTDLDNSTLEFLGKLSKGLNGFQIISYYERKSTNSRFSELGFETNHFFNNSEKFLIVFFGSIACYFFMIFFGFCYKSVHEFKEKTYLNLITRALIVCCFDFSLFGFLQIYHISLSTTYDTLCSIFGAIMIALYMVSLIYLPISIKSKTTYSNLEIHDSTLLYEFKYKESYNCYYYLIFIITRITSAIFLVFADKLPELQVSALSFCGLIHLTFLLKYRPYREELVNYLVTACEVCQLLIIISISCFLSDISTSASYLLRWLIIISFFSGLLLCILRFLYHMFSKSSSTRPKSQENLEDPDLKHKRDNSQTDMLSSNPFKSSDQFNPQHLIQTSKPSSRSGQVANSASRQSGKFSSKSSSRPDLNPSQAKAQNPNNVLPIIEDLEPDYLSQTSNPNILQTPQHLKIPSDDSQSEIENHFSGISYYPKLA